MLACCALVSCVAPLVLDRMWTPRARQATHGPNSCLQSVSLHFYVVPALIMPDRSVYQLLRLPVLFRRRRLVRQSTTKSYKIFLVVMRALRRGSDDPFLPWTSLLHSLIRVIASSLPHDVDARSAGAKPAPRDSKTWGFKAAESLCDPHGLQRIT